MDASEFPRLIAALQRPEAYPHPVDRIEHIETHISHVLLAGDFAYKLKKPLDLGFLDCSTLALRRHCCEEEIRLNSRLAPTIYLDVVAIGGEAAHPRIGAAGAVLEYAVRMRRFAQSALLAHRPLDGPLIDRLAERLADFHAAIPAAAPDAPWGAPDMVLAPMIENVEQIRARVEAPALLRRLQRIEDWTRARWRVLRPLLEQRRAEGWIRECHGDMHCGNIALIDGEPQIFDGIDFAPELRWIDTASELAFLVMDLEAAGEPGLAQRLLNGYLERGGDYGLLALLRLYQCYRAMVRAKVGAIRAGQTGLAAPERAAAWDACARYLALAEGYTRARRPRLLIACGLSGSGKSHMASALCERLPFVHLRSDVERKRLFGLEAQARTNTGVDGGIYFPSATDWTYERLLHLAETILASGHDVLVDATFTAHQRRVGFAALARRHHAGFAILALEAPLAVLRERVTRRLAAGNDASEATLAVLERQHARCEPPQGEECDRLVRVDTSADPAIERVSEQLETVFAGQAQSCDLAEPPH
ncbi:MAG: AAA family ATPase [Marichromatium sp.]|nr:AAA family ATPase [Marichromatium sp.]